MYNKVAISIVANIAMLVIYSCLLEFLQVITRILSKITHNYLQQKRAPDYERRLSKPTGK